MKLAGSLRASLQSIAQWHMHCVAGTKDVWEFLSAWSEVYGTEENTSLLKAMGHSLDAARTNVRRFAGDVGKVCIVHSGTDQLSSSPCPCPSREEPHLRAGLFQKLPAVQDDVADSERAPPHPDMHTCATMTCGIALCRTLTSSGGSPWQPSRGGSPLRTCRQGSLCSGRLAVSAR